MILGLCKLFHCTPDVAREMDASVLRLILIEQMGNPEPESPEYGEEEYY